MPNGDLMSVAKMDSRRQFVNRHFDKIIVARLILVCFLFQFLMLWISTEFPDNNWMRSIVSRAADLVGNIALALTGALTTLITGNKMNSRAGDSGPSVHSSPGIPSVEVSPKGEHQ